MYETLLKKLNRIESIQKEDRKKINQMYDSLVGNKLENRKGYIDIIQKNQQGIVENKEGIEKINSSLLKISKPYGKIIAGTAVGATGGGLLGSKWPIILQKILSIFS